MADKPIPQDAVKDKKSLERDFVFGILLVLVGVALCIYGNNISLDAMKVMDAQYYTAPGFFIVILGLALFAMAIYMIVNAKKNGATLAWLKPKALLARFKEDRALQTVVVFFYLFLYMVVFWENVPFTRIRIPFWLNTLVFMNLLMFTFKAAKPLSIIIISVATSTSIHFIFENLIGVPLP